MISTRPKAQCLHLTEAALQLDLTALLHIANSLPKVGIPARFKVMNPS
jgi:hypothetical protein